MCFDATVTDARLLIDVAEDGVHYSLHVSADDLTGVHVAPLSETSPLRTIDVVDHANDAVRYLTPPAYHYVWYPTLIGFVATMTRCGHAEEDVFFPSDVLPRADGDGLAWSDPNAHAFAATWRATGPVTVPAIHSEPARDVRVVAVVAADHPWGAPDGWSRTVDPEPLDVRGREALDVHGGATRLTVLSHVGATSSVVLPAEGGEDAPGVVHPVRRDVPLFLDVAALGAAVMGSITWAWRRFRPRGVPA